MSIPTDTNSDGSNRNLMQHLREYAEDAQVRVAYIEQAIRVFSDNIESKTFGSTYKARVIFTLLQNLDHDTFERFNDHLEVSDVFKACEMLDAPRLMRQLIKRSEKHNESHKIPMLINNHCVAYGDALCVHAQLRSVTKDEIRISFGASKINMIKKWTRSIPESKLEYLAVLFTTDNWKKLADLCHFSKADFAHDWFLDFCYGKPAPEDTICNAWHSLNLQNFGTIYDKYFSADFTYEIIRTKIDLKQARRTTGRIWNVYEYPVNDDKETQALKDEIRSIIIAKEGLTTVLWYWDELVTPRNIHDIVVRLRQGSDVNLSYGKIVDIISKTNDPEILSELINMAEGKAEQYEMSDDSPACPVAVLCDASSSMEIAIKTSSIITSLLCYLTNASLDVFGSNNLHIDNPPRTVQQAVEFGKTMKTRGCTCCASSIAHYYESKKVVKTFIIVTDEQENTPYAFKTPQEVNDPEKYSNPIYPSRLNDMARYVEKIPTHMFNDIYMKYIEEIYPAKLIFVSFSEPNQDALMVRDLRSDMDEDQFASLVEVFKFDVHNPDMNRMDVVLRYIMRL